MKNLFYRGLILLSLMFLVTPVFGNDNPVAMLQSVADQMITNLKSNKASLKMHPAFVYSLATKVVVPHADLEEMSKRVLPPQTWNKIPTSQRAQFQKEFTMLLVRTYASALADYNDQTIRFNPVRGGFQGKNIVQVDSQIIRTDGPAITVNYKLIKKGTDWKLYDMTVEGVSLLESYRSQFADKLARGNMSDLIRDLATHNSQNSGQ